MKKLWESIQLIGSILAIRLYLKIAEKVKEDLVNDLAKSLNEYYGGVNEKPTK